MKQIKLTQNKYAIVDNEDYEGLLEMGSWMYSSTGYAFRWDKWDNTTKHRNPIYIHRYLMKPPIDMVIDHINGNTLDNRKSNLRICTTAQNLRNRKLPITNKTGFHNVQYLAKYNKYRVQIKYKYESIYLGLYPTAVAAAKARDQYVKKNFEGFARLNFN